MLYRAAGSGARGEGEEGRGARGEGEGEGGRGARGKGEGGRRARGKAGGGSGGAKSSRDIPRPRSRHALVHADKSQSGLEACVFMDCGSSFSSSSFPRCNTVEDLQEVQYEVRP